MQPDYVYNTLWGQDPSLGLARAGVDILEGCKGYIQRPYYTLYME